MTDFTNPEAVKNFNKSIVDEFRANGGKVTGPFTQAALLLLTTTGAKSGRRRVSPLAYFDIDDKLPPAEREELFPKLTAVAQVIAESQSKTSRVIPLFELQQA
jgi:hypothetical protein